MYKPATQQSDDISSSVSAAAHSTTKARTGLGGDPSLDSVPIVTILWHRGWPVPLQHFVCVLPLVNAETSFGWIVNGSFVFYGIHYLPEPLEL